MKLLNKVISSNKINPRKKLQFYDNNTLELSEIEKTDIILYELLRVNKAVNVVEAANIDLNISISTIGIYSSFIQAYEAMKTVGMICLSNSNNKLMKKADYEAQEIISHEGKIEYNYLGDRYIINKVVYKRDKEIEEAVYKEHEAIADFKEG